MKISIVTISYNQGEYLEETINSVLNQRGVDVEYIIADAGSTDCSRAIIEKYRSRIAHIIFEKDNGPGDGLNKAFALATGDLFGFINSDDILMPGALRKLVAFYDKNKVDVISAHAYVIDEFSIIRHKIFSYKLNHSTYNIKQFACGNKILVQQSTFFTRAIFYKTCGFDGSGKIVWDAGLFLDFILCKAKFAVVDDLWSAFRVYPQSLTGSGLFKNYQVFNTLQHYYGIKAISPSQKKLLSILKLIEEPDIFLKRIIDGFFHPARLT